MPGIFHLACVFKIHPYRNMYQNFIPFYGHMVFHGVDGPDFVYSFTN